MNKNEIRECILLLEEEIKELKKTRSSLDNKLKENAKREGFIYKMLKNMEETLKDSLQGQKCDHRFSNGNASFEYTGHDSHKDYYKCTICGEETSV